jgi:hypothetical protein
LYEKLMAQTAPPVSPATSTTPDVAKLVKSSLDALVEITKVVDAGVSLRHEPQVSLIEALGSEAYLELKKLELAHASSMAKLVMSSLPLTEMRELLQDVRVHAKTASARDGARAAREEARAAREEAADEAKTRLLAEEAAKVSSEAALTRAITARVADAQEIRKPGWGSTVLSFGDAEVETAAFLEENERARKASNQRIAAADAEYLSSIPRADDR